MKKPEGSSERESYEISSWYRRKTSKTIYEEIPGESSELTNAIPRGTCISWCFFFLDFKRKFCINLNALQENLTRSNSKNMLGGTSEDLLTYKNTSARVAIVDNMHEISYKYPGRIAYRNEQHGSSMKFLEEFPLNFKKIPGKNATESLVCSSGKNHGKIWTTYSKSNRG